MDPPDNAHMPEAAPLTGAEAHALGAVELARQAAGAQPQNAAGARFQQDLIDSLSEVTNLITQIARPEVVNTIHAAQSLRREPGWAAPTDLRDLAWNLGIPDSPALAARRESAETAIVRLRKEIEHGREHALSALQELDLLHHGLIADAQQHGDSAARRTLVRQQGALRAAVQRHSQSPAPTNEFEDLLREFERAQGMQSMNPPSTGQFESFESVPGSSSNLPGTSSWPAPGTADQSASSQEQWREFEFPQTSGWASSSNVHGDFSWEAPGTAGPSTSHHGPWVMTEEPPNVAYSSSPTADPGFHAAGQSYAAYPTDTTQAQWTPGSLPPQGGFGSSAASGFSPPSSSSQMMAPEYQEVPADHTSHDARIAPPPRHGATYPPARRRPPRR